MKIELDQKEIGILRVVSQIAGGFILVVSFTMIFSLAQLKILNPLDNPVLINVKEQFDKDPSNQAKAEQVRALDLMARKAYFSSRWQVETGAYLLLAGAIVFFLCNRIISDNEKINPVLSDIKNNGAEIRQSGRKYLVVSASVILVIAFAASFMLRANLPDTIERASKKTSSKSNSKTTAPKPDKINYPFFRGQDSRGIAGGSGYPTEWDGESGKNILWKVNVPKQGKSSPVIWDDKIFITGAQDKSCEVYCFDKNKGSLIWTGSVSAIEGEPAELPAMDAEGGLSVPSVATNGKYACATFANGNIACFDMDGKRIWAKNIGVPVSTYGYSSSPVIYENLLIIQYDSNTKLSLFGFDIATGELKWETIRTGRPVWSSPVIAYFDGKAQIIINGNPKVSSYEAESGKELWSIEALSGDVAPSVAVNSSMVYAVTDYAKLAAIKPGTGASIAWQDNTYTPDVSSPAANDKFLFVSTGNGDVACYNAEKGDTAWTHYFSDQFYASPIIADDYVYLLDRSGVMHIVKAGSKYELIGESKLGEGTDCTPAFSDKKIFLRSKNYLYCISKN
jgi:outer membrane protein assembly factor BamB